MLSVREKLNVYRKLVEARRYDLAAKFEARHADDAEFVAWINVWKALTRGLLAGFRQGALRAMGPERN
jgi:hypothetical protein